MSDLTPLQTDIDTTPYDEVVWNGKRILLATSRPDCVDKLLAFLQGEGLVVTCCDSAEETESVFDPDNFELLIIDVELEGKGMEVGFRIKHSMRENFVPLLYITPHLDEISLASCFEAGGDDLVTVPYSDTMLFSRINALLKMGGSYRQQFRERLELAYYRQVSEAEQKMAKSIFSSVVHQDHLNRDNIQYTVSPISILNGDMLLAASTPNGHEFIILGDFTGHGLTASVGTLPASEIFYTMTAKGFTLGMILSEINNRLKQLLPIGMFMATVAIDINYYENAISIWAGGIPDLILRRNTGEVEVHPAQNLPLGIIESNELSLEMDVLPINPGDRFYIYTDGVTETENPEGVMFGVEGLQNLITSSADHENIFSNIMRGIEHYRGGLEQSDDITLLEYTHPDDGDRNWANLEHDENNEEILSEWSVELKLDVKAIRQFDPRPILTQLVVDLQSSQSFHNRVYTILTELLNNAIDYGLLGMDSAFENTEGDLRRYKRERQLRLDNLQSGFLLLKLENKLIGNNRGQFIISVKDSGNGFDFTKLENSLGDEGIQGLSLLRKLSDEINFEDAGSRVSVICSWNYNS